MPLVEQSAYNRPPFYLLNGHMETVIPSMFFKVKESFYQRERLELSDGDFLDIDWVSNDSNRCIVLSHGLEGDSNRYYVKRTARFFTQQGWDVAAWNCRSCGGEMNMLPRFYHHGDTPDLHEVVCNVLGKGYQQVVLMGYSMGGSMTLKYLGEAQRDPRIVGAVTFSVPCSLRDSAIQLTKKGNRFYEKRFVKKLIHKIREKAETHHFIDISEINNLLDFDTFHDRYTVPLHGFKDLDDFFSQSTCDQYLPDIKVPTLIVNALNDPMLGDLCYPKALASSSRWVYLETPKRGGHVGFTLKNRNHSYMELRAMEFIKAKILENE